MMRCCTVIVVSLVVAAGLPAADPPKDKLAELVKLYQAYELPLPPKEASLYLEQWTTEYDGPKSRKEIVQLVFGLAPDKSSRPTRTWANIYGDQPVHPTNRIEAVKLDVQLLETVKVLEYFDVCLAVQCELRGWHDLANALLDGAMKTTERTPEQSLAREAWSYWGQRFRDPATDRAKVARRLKMVMTAEPKLFKKMDRDFLKHLEQSLKPTASKPGSLESLIDDLLDVHEANAMELDQPDPRFLAILRYGFDAVPTLIDHLDDHRVTRVFQGAFMNNPNFYLRVRHFSSSIVVGFYGSEGHEITDRIFSPKPNKAELKKWWAETTKEGEEAYAVKHVLGVHPKEKEVGEYLIWLIGQKYPKRLPEVFRKLLADRPEMTLWPVALAVSRSTLPKEMKRSLYLEAIDSKKLEWKRNGLSHLIEVDQEEFHKRLIDTLASLSSTPSVPYDRCDEGGFVYEVGLTSDEKVWDAAERYLRKADAGLRLEWFDRIGLQELPTDTRTARIAFLVRFLSDDSVRDPESKPSHYGTFYAGKEFGKLEVRNYAALALGLMLDLKTKPSPKWTAEEWAKFRDEVAKAAKTATQPGK